MPDFHNEAWQLAEELRECAGTGSVVIEKGTRFTICGCSPNSIPVTAQRLRMSAMAQGLLWPAG